MKTLINGALLATSLLMLGCGGSGVKPGALLGEAKVFEQTSQEVHTLLDGGIIDANTTVFGYTAYKITYMTTDEKGYNVEASGLMTIPVGLPEQITEGIGLSIVSDDHGTIFANDEAPTPKAVAGSVDTPLIFTALSGFVTLQPDYIGFGDSSDHYHPYVLKESLANATIDFIKAARTFAQEKGIKLNGQLFVTGYSEGGYAALATMEKIEKEGELNVTIAAPMAGPYAMNEMAMGVLSQDYLSVPSFMADIGYAYAKTYDKELTEVINEPYASKLSVLFDGNYTRTQIDANLTYLTTGTDGLFNPLLVQAFFTDPDNWFKQAMLENNVHTWAPQTQVKLVHCQGDDVIPFAIAQLAADTMIRAGAVDVSIVPVEATLTGDDTVQWGHGACALPAYQVAAGLFVEARQRLYHY